MKIQNNKNKSRKFLSLSLFFNETNFPNIIWKISNFSLKFLAFVTHPSSFHNSLATSLKDETKLCSSLYFLYTTELTIVIVTTL